MHKLFFLIVFLFSYNLNSLTFSNGKIVEDDNSISSNQISAENNTGPNPLKFLKEEVLFGLAKNHLNKDRDSIGNKAISIYEGSDGKGFRIDMDTKIRGGYHDEKYHHRWELSTDQLQRFYNHDQAMYFKYEFKVPSFENLDLDSGIGGTLFQAVGNNTITRVNPWLGLRYYNADEGLGSGLYLTLKLINGKQSRSPGEIEYIAYLGERKKFAEFNTFDFKILPSKNEKGEIIVWLNGELVFEMYGRNIWGGTSHWSTKIGQYRWWWDYIEYLKGDKDKVPVTSSVIKKLGYDKTCENILDEEQCSYVSETRNLYAKHSILQKVKKNVNSAPEELFKISKIHKEIKTDNSNNKCWIATNLKIKNKNTPPASLCGGTSEYLNHVKSVGEVSDEDYEAITIRWES